MTETSVILDWITQTAETGDEIKHGLKAATPTYERDVLLASTLRLLEKCREEIAEMKAAIPAPGADPRR